MTGDLRALARLWPLLAEHRGKFLGALSANFLGQFAAVGAAVGAAWLAGQVVTNSQTSVFTGTGRWVTAIVLSCVVVVAVATWWEMLVSHDLAYVVLATLRVRLFDRLRRTVPSRTAARRSGDLSSTALGDIESLEWIYAHVFAQIFVAGSVVAAGATALGAIYPLLLLVLLPAAAAVASVPWWLRRIGDRQGSALREQSARLGADIVDTIQGLPELTAAGALGRRRRELAGRTAALNRLGRRTAGRGGIEAAATDLLISLAAVGSLLITMIGVQGGDVPPALAPVVLTLAGAVLAPAAMIAGTLKESGSLRAAASRIFDLMDTPDSAPETDQPRTPDRTYPGPIVRFRDVTFGYQPDRAVLTGLDFEVFRGEVVALVGASGAGKTTAMSLLQRFWDPDGGQILLDGVDLRDLPDAELRRRATVVPQDVHLFAGTLADNITLGRPDTAPAELRAVVDTAQLTSVIDRLPDGLEATVGERGARLSGGERARVAIARALLMRARVLILDEAVANLDATSERELHRAMISGSNDRATLVIAHRPSTIDRADRVLVLQGGRIIEQGTPAELASRRLHLRGQLPNAPDAGVRSGKFSQDD